MSYLSKVAIAGALAVGLTGAASAATLSLEAGGTSVALTTGFGPTGSGVYKGTTGGLNPGDLVTAYTDGVSGNPETNVGLKVNGAAKLRFTLLGFEAGAENVLVTPGATLTKSVANIGSSILSDIIVNALADFGFTTNPIPRPTKLGIAFSDIFAGGKSVIALFDDGRRTTDPKYPEPDYDDMVVQIDVAPVPVPAAGLMLVGALGGLAAVRRRKAKA